MITNEELAVHHSLCRAPIDPVWARRQIKKLKKLPEGRLIWVSDESERGFPVEFVSVDEHDHYTGITYKSIIRGKGYTSKTYYYTYIRECTEGERETLLTDLRDKVKILTSATAKWVCP